MEKLSDDWLTDGLIDFEYKKYILLSYLQKVKNSFDKTELYPHLADLVHHYNNLVAFKENKEHLAKNFPSKAEGLDMKKLEIIYHELIKDDEVMKELSEIIEYAVPQFKSSLEEGKEIYEFVESHCELSPVGLLPLYVDEGYLFINTSSSADTSVYRYQVTLIQGANENFRGIHISFLDKLTKGVGETYEALKSGIIRRFRDLPNPATFIIHSRLHFPFAPTLVPVAKRLLVRYISTA